ncbi:MAG: beta-propeller fold lactonase family protein [Ginsengibacter sp.]
MKKINLFKVSMVAVIMFGVVSCNKNADKNMNQAAQPKTVTEDMMSENGANPDEVAINTENGAISDNTKSANKSSEGHYLYTESNEAGTNRILTYKILFDGTLHLEGTTASGGAGKGKGLGSQGALFLDKQHEWLYAVNAGSNSVSSFKVHNDGSLTLAHTENSGGVEPNSVSAYGNLLYVLNHGSDNIHGFRIGTGGTLTHIEGSTKPLSSTAVDAPQISFTPGGDWVIVTEKATNNISSFKLKRFRQGRLPSDLNLHVIILW